jgi:hypothetical protein
VAPTPLDQANQASRVREIRGRLAKPVALENGIQANTSLRDALEFMSDRYDLTIFVNTEAFKAANVEMIEDTPVKLPKMLGVNLGTVLQLLTDQVHGTFLIRPDSIEIVPFERARPEFWQEKRTLAPTVNAEFAGRALDEALQELSDSSGISVVLDGRAKKKAKVCVTARLNNVSIDTAVLILADMADLRLVVLDNVLYVTTKGNALQVKGWHERQCKKSPK